VIRMVCEITNYGGTAAVIHHIGVQYNVTKRMQRDSSGNIRREPIDLVVDESSSSRSDGES
jgi:hypothetical protein